MELDSFLASPRWEILQLISAQPSSPIEIAAKLNTTVSYISQQMKLLEAAGLVKKEKTGAVERGKPRTIFSIAKELVYLTPLSNTFSTKKALYLTDYHKLVLKIWFTSNNSLHEPLHKLLIKIEKYFPKIDFIGIDSSKYPVKLIFIVNEKSFKVADFIDEKIFSTDTLSENQLSKMDLSEIQLLHDPKNIFNRMKNLKGGNIA